MAKFDEATAVRRVAEGRYQAELDPGYSFVGTVNGGYLMAVALRAAVDASPHEHPVSTAANFLRTAQGGPAQVWVEPRKAGRTVATSRVTIVQNDDPIVDLQVTTATLGEDEPDWSSERSRPLPPLSECIAFDSGKPGRGFPDQVEMHYDPAVMGWLDGRPSGRLEGGGYFRLKHGIEPDPYVLAMAVDSLPPVALNTGGQGWAPTVELTWHLRALPAPGWLELIGGGRLVTGGWFDEEVEVWDSAGRLVAQSRQLARVGRGGR